MWRVGVFSLHWKIKWTFCGFKNLLRVAVSLSLMPFISLDFYILWEGLPALRSRKCLLGCQVENPSSQSFICLENIFTFSFVSQTRLYWLRNTESVCPAHSPAWLYNQPTLACVSTQLISLMSTAINRSSGIIFKADKPAAWYVGTATGLCESNWFRVPLKINTHFATVNILRFLHLFLLAYFKVLFNY